MKRAIHHALLVSIVLTIVKSAKACIEMPIHHCAHAPMLTLMIEYMLIAKFVMLSAVHVMVHLIIARSALVSTEHQ